MPNNITVVNKHHGASYDVYIGRGSKWGNPFSHIPSKHVECIASTREEAIEMYRMWIQTQPHLMNSLHELDGKVLGCFCEPLACHGHVLAELRREQLNNSKD